jgi:hypothetical protein
MGRRTTIPVEQAQAAEQRARVAARNLRQKARLREDNIRALVMVGYKPERIAKIVGTTPAMLSDAYGDILSETPRQHRAMCYARLMALAEEGDVQAIKLLLMKLEPGVYGNAKKAPDPDAGLPPTRIILDFRPPPADGSTLPPPTGDVFDHDEIPGVRLVLGPDEHVGR